MKILKDDAPCEWSCASIQMNKLVSIIACISIYGLGFLHGNSSDSKLMGYLICGVIGYFVGTAIYQYIRKN